MPLWAASILKRSVPTITLTSIKTAWWLIAWLEFDHWGGHTWSPIHVISLIRMASLLGPENWKSVNKFGAEPWGQFLINKLERICLAWNVKGRNVYGRNNHFH